MLKYLIILVKSKDIRNLSRTNLTKAKTQFFSVLSTMLNYNIGLPLRQLFQLIRFTKIRLEVIIINFVFLGSFTSYPYKFILSMKTGCAVYNKSQILKMDYIDMRSIDGMTANMDLSIPK
jgi:hypothetical protein